MCRSENASSRTGARRSPGVGQGELQHDGRQPSVHSRRCTPSPARWSDCRTFEGAWAYRWSLSTAAMVINRTLSRNSLQRTSQGKKPSTDPIASGSKGPRASHPGAHRPLHPDPTCRRDIFPSLVVAAQPPPTAMTPSVPASSNLLLPARPSIQQWPRSPTAARAPCYYLAAESFFFAFPGSFTASKVL